MSAESPGAVVDKLLTALRDRDLESVVALYDQDATIIVTPGLKAQGTASIRTFFEGAFSLKNGQSYEAQHLIEAGDLALFTAQWSILGPIPPSARVPRTNYQAAILRKQPDGSWLIAVDKIWGAAASLTEQHPKE